MAFIVATSTGFPPNYYSQEVLANLVRKYCLSMALDFDLNTIDHFFTDIKIKGRYFALPLESFYDPPTIEESSKAAIKAAVNLSEITVRKLLEQTNLDPKEVSQMTSVSITTTLPSLDARLMNRIPFSPNLKRMPLGGLGCVGGAIGLSRVTDYLQGHPQEAAILFAVELASFYWQGSLQGDLHYMIGHLSKEPHLYSEIITTILTAASFGDGAAAVLMVGRDHCLAHSGQPEVIGTRSNFIPNTEDVLGMDIVDTGIRNIWKLSVVGEFTKIGLRQAIDGLLTEYGISIDQISYWMVHPGAIQPLEQEFGLNEPALKLSRKTLVEVGNLSSPTVLCVLDTIFSEEQPVPGAYGLVIGIGPGFSQEVVLLQW
ncbi:3-oxoacyl-ACP synthase [Chlorogloeopsis sp. ULAP01]|uniref:type III polyketide synthase n=1 Tax=Chlorogloeopsis sp. ULAP01 TaxID=3056483 RepID=UPI0025AA3B63|nr:3-oxoacyl-ACP synthase [Chlorogloeopsis sp. ULAP01]MDM9383686.1 3-oxoacyl-ACP synthase [Chlorogloeopsis sp. ULAP01]